MTKSLLIGLLAIVLMLGVSCGGGGGGTPTGATDTKNGDGSGGNGGGGGGGGAADGGGDVGVCLETKTTMGKDVKCNGDSGGPFFTLTVKFAGNGFGSVSDHFNVVDQNGNPADTLSFDTCRTGSGDCTQRYVPNTLVELRSQADNGSTFAGFSGACGGASTCLVTMNSNKSVTATFMSP